MTVEVEKPDLKRSVTEQDAPPSNAVFPMTFLPYGMPGFPGYRGWTDKLLPELPGYWCPQRDMVLAATVERSGFWSSAVAIAVSMAAARAWELEGGNPLQRRRAQDLFHGANAGEGFGHFISQHLTDYLTTDNGAFVEIVRASDSPAAKIVGLFHLDSLRCRRTGNPETPVIYQDLYGNWHNLKWYQVFSIADSPNARSNYFGIGHCSAARAYDRIRRMEAIEVYDYEKMTGGSPHEMHFTNLHRDQLQGILAMDTDQRAAAGLFIYKGHTIIPAIVKDGEVKITDLKLAALPDNFDSEKELQQAQLAFANAIGMDFQDLMPLSQSNLGNSTQSKVLHQKAKGKGLAFWATRWEYFTSNHVLPGHLEWHYVERDLQDELLKAQVEQVQVNNVMTAMGAQAGPVISAEQGLNKLVDENVFPKEYLPQDVTPDTTLADDEKPMDAVEGADDLTQEVSRVGQQLNQALTPATPGGQ